MSMGGDVLKVNIRKGDTLWYISQLFDVPLQLILDCNPSVNPQQLVINQTINIPGYVKRDIRIERGDTLWSIANDRRVALDSLFMLNEPIDPFDLRPGRSIKVPLRIRRPVIDNRQPYDYPTFLRDLKRLETLYPFISTRIIGQSVQGKNIYEILIGNGAARVHANGSFHAREWITTPIIMTFLNDYLLALSNRETIRGLSMAPFYDTKTLSLVPMLNPDGVDLVINGPPENSSYYDYLIGLNNGSMDFSQWKANIRGVDLNNQFPANWAFEAERKPQQPAPEDYPGPAPLSEPESEAIAQLTRDSNFQRVLAFHTQGEVIFWGYEGYEPPESQVIVEEFARVSGYEPIQYVDSHAGYKDWFILEWQKPGYTIELGEGSHPLPLSQFDQIYQESLGIFLANMYM